MFEKFDFSVLESDDFKEDSVREEIIAPIIRRLGYQPSGSARVQRSKSLVHPYVMIGSKKHKVNIVPDYTLYVDEIPVAIIEAKGPQESIFKSEHVEQAYSYAIHPEIRADYYALCNGRELIVYALKKWEPVLRVNIPEIERRWLAVEEALLPKYLLNPELRGFMPDYGMAMLKMGFDKGLQQHFIMHRLQFLMRAEDELYIANTTTGVGEDEFLVTLDFGKPMYEKLLSLLPPEVSDAVSHAMKRAPFQAGLGGKVAATVIGHFGESAEGAYEEFVPIVVDDVVNAVYEPDFELQPYTPKYAE